MPIYEYRCEKCGHEFEIIQQLSDKPLKKCPKCEGKLEKLLSRTAFILKGGGWYADGYGGKKKGESAEKSEKSAASESSASAKSGPKSDAKSESKPEAKTAAKSESKGKKESGGKGKSG